MRLKNKVIVVTGGNSGIGLAIAQDFKNEGAKGVIVGRNSERLEEASKALGDDFIAIKADVTNMDDLKNLFEKTHEKFGNIDVVVANAGGGIGEGTFLPFADVDEKSFDAMVDVNFKSAFFTVQNALPFMNDGSSVVLVSSIVTHKGFPGTSVYTAAKGAVRTLARTLSAELLDRKIRVNVLSPGPVETPVFEKFGLPPEAVPETKAFFTSIVPMKRIGQPEEMAKVATFLASSDSSYILGEEIRADGGVVNL